MMGGFRKTLPKLSFTVTADNPTCGCHIQETPCRTTLFALALQTPVSFVMVDVYIKIPGSECSRASAVLGACRDPQQFPLTQLRALQGKAAHEAATIMSFFPRSVKHLVRLLVLKTAARSALCPLR